MTGPVARILVEGSTVLTAFIALETEVPVAAPHLHVPAGTIMGQVNDFAGFTSLESEQELKSDLEIGVFVAPTVQAGVQAANTSKVLSGDEDEAISSSDAARRVSRPEYGSPAVYHHQFSRADGLRQEWPLRGVADFGFADPLYRNVTRARL